MLSVKFVEDHEKQRRFMMDSREFFSLGYADDTLEKLSTWAGLAYDEAGETHVFMFPGITSKMRNETDIHSPAFPVEGQILKEDCDRFRTWAAAYKRVYLVYKDTFRVPFGVADLGRIEVSDAPKLFGQLGFCGKMSLRFCHGQGLKWLLGDLPGREVTFEDVAERLAAKIERELQVVFRENVMSFEEIKKQLGEERFKKSLWHTFFRVCYQLGFLVDWKDFTIENIGFGAVTY